MCIYFELAELHSVVPLNTDPHMDKYAPGQRAEIVGPIARGSQGLSPAQVAVLLLISNTPRESDDYTQ